MIVVIGGYKGGSGKTLLATNLAVIRSQHGRKVLLVDGDEQRSSSQWMNKRKINDYKNEIDFVQIEGKTFHNQIKKIEDRYDDIIIDVGGRNTSTQVAALSCADIFLTPFRPCWVETKTIEDLDPTLEVIKGLNPKIKFIGVVNQANASGKDNDKALENIKSSPHLICYEGLIGERKVFSRAFEQGLSVVEVLVKKPSVGLEKSQKEIKELYEYVFNV